MYDTSIRPNNQHFLSYFQVIGFQFKFSDLQLPKIIRHFTNTYLLLRGLRPVHLAPFSQTLPQIVAIPKSPVKHGRQPFFPIRNLLRPIASVKISIQCLVIALANSLHILRRTGTPFNLENPHPGINHFINKTDRTQIFRRHDIFPVNLQFYITLGIFHRIRTPAYLVTSPPICRSIHLVKTQITFTRNRHTQSPVRKHLDLDQFPLGTTQIVLNNLPVNCHHLIHIQLPRQHHDIRKLCVELHRLVIGNITLRADMHFHPYRPGIQNSRNIRSYNCRHPGILRTLDHLVHLLKFVIIYNRIHREISLHLSGITTFHDIPQIIQREISR